MVVYIGIAVVSGAPGLGLPVYASPGDRGAPIGYLVRGAYVPHFQATDDHAWLEVTLHNGSTGWLLNDPAYVTVVLPDPTRLRVCIDPGHGGSETGAVASGLVEKDLNFDVAYWKLFPRLLATPQIERVWLTRNGDYEVSLKYRWDLANASFAALFVSIHSNSHPDPAVRGPELYFKCGVEAPEWLRAKSGRAACLTSLRLRERIDRFGSLNCPWVDREVICRLISETDSRSYYFVLENTNVPAILVECMYMSNPDEARCLASETFRDLLAQGIYEGIIDALFTTAPGNLCTFRTLYGL